MTEKDFQWDAKLYQESSSFQFKLGLMSIERLEPKDGETILEIGSGNGMVTIELARKIPNGKIIGIEISKEMCEQARENFRENGISNVELNNIDALDISYSNQFDAVFSNSAIHWIKNLELIYKLIYDALKDNGRILVQTNLKEISPIVSVFIKLVKNKEYRKYFSNFSFPWRYLTLKENERLLEGLNFREIDIDPYEFLLEFGDRETAINYWKAAGLVPFLSYLPNDLKEDFVENFKVIYFEIIENPIEYKMTRLFISAIK